MLKSGWRLFLTGRDSLRQTCHDEFIHGELKNLGFFIVTRKKRPCLYMSPGLYDYLRAGANLRINQIRLLKIERVTIQEKSVLIGHWYVQHAPYDRTGIHFFWQQTLVVPKRVSLRDGVVFEHGPV